MLGFKESDNKVKKFIPFFLMLFIIVVGNNDAIGLCEGNNNYNSHIAYILASDGIPYWESSDVLQNGISLKEINSEFAPLLANSTGGDLNFLLAGTYYAKMSLITKKILQSTYDAICDVNPITQRQFFWHQLFLFLPYEECREVNEPIRILFQYFELTYPSNMEFENLSAAEKLNCDIYMQKMVHLHWNLLMQLTK